MGLGVQPECCAQDSNPFDLLERWRGHATRRVCVGQCLGQVGLGWVCIADRCLSCAKGMSCQDASFFSPPHGCTAAPPPFPPPSLHPRDPDCEGHLDPASRDAAASPARAGLRRGLLDVLLRVCATDEVRCSIACPYLCCVGASAAGVEGRELSAEPSVDHTDPASKHGSGSGPCWM